LIQHNFSIFIRKKKIYIYTEREREREREERERERERESERELVAYNSTYRHLEKFAIS